MCACVYVHRLYIVNTGTRTVPLRGASPTCQNLKGIVTVGVSSALLLLTRIQSTSPNPATLVLSQPFMLCGRCYFEQKIRINIFIICAYFQIVCISVDGNFGMEENIFSYS